MSDMDYGLLNERFGIRSHLKFKPGAGDLPVAEVSNSHAHATIAFQGAHLLTWAPRRQSPVIWLSRAAKFVLGKSVRGGVPLCWPWFGPHVSEAKYPSHGFARTVMWEVAETQALPDDRIRLVFKIVQDEASRALWPHPSEALCVFTVGSSLEIELITRNTGKDPFTLGDALHTYFEVSDIRHCRIHGLGNSAYIDKVDGGKKKNQTGAIQIDGEVDRIYLSSSSDVLIDDPGRARRIRIAKRGSHSTVVWNPGIEKATKMGDFGVNGYLDMVCVESSNAADDVVQLPAGHEHRLWVRYSVEPLR